MKILKLKWLSLIVSILLLLVLAASSCTYANTKTADIVSSAQTAGANVQTYQFDVNLSLNLVTSGSTSASNMNINVTGDGTGALDKAQKDAHGLFNVSADIPVLGKQNIPIEYYLAGGWIYMKLGIPMLGDQWNKVQAQEPQWETEDQIAQQLGFLKTAVQIEQEGSENVDNVDCYVLAVKPDLTKISEWLTSLEQSLGSETQQFSLPAAKPGTDLSKFIKQLTIKEWVAKDTYLIAKAEIGMDISMRAADFGLPTKTPEATAGGALSRVAPAFLSDAKGQMTVNVSASIKYHDYNQPVTVTLPPEAQNAKEMSKPGK
ncbi:MAG TPA: DUF6612 family protein [Dehalococcoidales bacterium]